MVPGRRSIRLKAFDYAGNAVYFLTLCAHQRRHRFGEVDDGFMALNDVGAMVEREWVRSATIRAELELHSFVIITNHLHALILFKPPDAGIAIPSTDGVPVVGARGARPTPHSGMFRRGGVVDDEKGARHAPLRAVPRSLSSFIGGFKSATTREFRAMAGDPGGALWQRGYYEHVVRDEQDFARIADYIAHNPMNWQFDQENVNRKP